MADDGEYIPNEYTYYRTWLLYCLLYIRLTKIIFNSLQVRMCFAFLRCLTQFVVLPESPLVRPSTDS